MRTGFCRPGRPTEGRRPMWWMEAHQPADLRTAGAPDSLHAGQCSRGRLFRVFETLTTDWILCFPKPSSRHRPPPRVRVGVWAHRPTTARERAHACAAARVITPGGEQDFVRVEAGGDHNHHRTRGRDVRSTALNAVEFDREFYIRGWCVEVVFL